jgi:oligopeptide/dipeptide ABC transporter ATP-binding protein
MPLRSLAKPLSADRRRTDDALDVTIQAENTRLARGDEGKFHLALLLITHDLGVVAGHAGSLAVMYAGRIVEKDRCATFSNAKHPYTQGLLASIPGAAPGGGCDAIDGTVPNLAKLPPGCAFEPRCPQRFELCPTAPPPAYDVGPGRAARCLSVRSSRRREGAAEWRRRCSRFVISSNSFRDATGFLSKPTTVRA